MFNRSSQIGLVDHVAGQIESAIVAGKLEPGDKLPPSEELQESLGASRGTLREAFRILRQKGLVKAKSGAGGGVFVSEITPDPIGESLALLIRTQRLPLEQLAEFREGVEGCAAALAAKSLSADGLVTMKDLLAKLMAHALSGPNHWDEFHEVEARLHQTLVRLSGNPLYEINAITVHENIGVYYRDYLPKTQAVLDRNCDDWSRMVLVLEQGRGDTLAELIRAHIKHFGQGMIKSRRLTESR